MVEGAALEMRYTRKGIVSSNLTSSALKVKMIRRIICELSVAGGAETCKYR